MKRRPAALTDQNFDVVVLGGGVLGACVARDAAMRGLTTALIEAADFASGTSCNSLKVIHGGLRHLQHLDLTEVHACARERSVWLRIAPHLVAPLPVMLPLFGLPAERVAYRAALALNDLISAGRNRALDDDRRIPPGRMLSRRECLDRVPELESTRLSGGMLYVDAQAYSTERLVLEVVESAVQSGAVAVNHAECVGSLFEGGRRVGILVRDRLAEAEFPVRARTVVNACGPGAPALTARLLGRQARHPGRLSLAWNLVLEGTGHEVAFALPGENPTPTAARGTRPRRLFFVPWRGRTLLGTGHAHFEGDPAGFDGIDRAHPELLAFVEEVDRAWPGGPLGTDRPLLVHSGLLPAVGDGEGEVRLRRKHTITVDSDGGVPVVTATTVKLTAARRVAENAVDRACELLAHRGVPSRTADTPLPGAPAEGVAALLRSARADLRTLLDSDVIEHLVRSYGTRYPAVLAGPRATERVREASPVVLGQLLLGARDEMACTEDDLLCRRTELAAREAPTEDLRRLARQALAESRHEVTP